MSYRELRNFTEIMKALGYPTVISVENFRTPNFERVADVLFWLVHRYDPTAELSDDISDDKGVEFLKSVAQIIYNKAHVKLNIKQLYKGDGFAVKELLKVSTLLYNALQTDTSEADVQGMSDIAISSKLKELQESDNLAPKIVDGGAKVYALLANEDKLKKSRDRAIKFIDSLSMNLENNDPHEQIQRNIREQINLVDDNIRELDKLTKGLSSDEKELSAKIDKKRKELIRMETKFSTVKQQVPTFMKEYNHLEEELRHIYDTYLERFRNLHYLESELSKYHEAEMEKKAESDRALKRMQRRLREEEVKLMRGEGSNRKAFREDEPFSSGEEEPSESEEASESSQQDKGGHVVGRMDGGEDSDSSSGSSSDSESRSEYSESNSNENWRSDEEESSQSGEHDDSGAQDDDKTWF